MYFWIRLIRAAGTCSVAFSAKRSADGAPVVYDGIGTMSKSKNNGVDPQALIDKYGWLAQDAIPIDRWRILGLLLLAAGAALTLSRT
jgi:hypothetical protein